MSGKKWGEHPVVVIIGVLAGLSAIGGLAYTISANSNSREVYPASNSASQDSTINDIDGDGNSVAENSNNNSSINSRSEGDNSPSISNANGDVNVSYNALEEEIPEFTGAITNGEVARQFREFTQENDNKVVYIDARIPNSAHGAADRRERIDVCHKGSVNAMCSESEFTVLYDCSDPDPGGAAPPCYAMQYAIKMPEDSNNLFAFTTGSYSIKGYWVPQFVPDVMIQGKMYSTLSAVKPQDAR